MGTWAAVIEQQTAKFQGSTWQEGADAARAGKPVEACPYRPERYDWVTWMNGWTWARHNDAREEWEI